MTAPRSAMPKPVIDQIAAFRAEVKKILAPAITTRAPYARVMLDMIAEAFAAQLSQVWNARGAADCEQVKTADATAEPVEDVLTAIRSLDR